MKKLMLIITAMAAIILNCAYAETAVYAEEYIAEEPVILQNYEEENGLFEADDKVIPNNVTDIDLDTDYTKSWTTSLIQPDHYDRFTLPSNGIISIDASKPVDSNSQYGALNFKLYNENNDLIWENHSNSAKNSPANAYSLKAGLGKGTYYLSINPRFSVSSGTVSSTYKVIFEENSCTELEPNDTLSEATVLEPGKQYQGFYGSDGYGNAESKDYWKCYLNAGDQYRFLVGNYKYIESTTAILYIRDTNGTNAKYNNGFTDLSYKLKDFVDENGNNYVEYTPARSGYYTIELSNYTGEQFSYTIGITEKKVNATRFMDVQDSSKFYYQPVYWAVEKGITTGTTKTTFSPMETCTRAQIVTFLYRAAGEPSVEVSNTFSDVPADKYYARAVSWAVANGITAGTTEATFSPDEPCTRAQAVTFMYRAAGAPEAASNNWFIDVPSSRYYANAVTWASLKGITAGTTAITFSPDDACTRGQIVTFIYRSMN